ncbi:hypothetical protein [Paludibacterium denitrificans]|nr:hypothetical protein [Paludibacterium denitrificans]
MGGATAKRADLAAHTYREPVTNQYGEESAVIRGVDGFGVVAISRIHEWTVQPASEAATADGAGRRDDGQRDGGVSRSWTRVNNCTATGQSRADYRESLLDEVEVFDDFHTESSFIFHPPGWIH